MPYFEGISYPLRTEMIIEFEKPSWKKRGRRFVKVGSQIIKGKIVKDSYGDEKGQHTFTIQDDAGVKHLIKGRHLYPTANIISLGDYQKEVI